MTTATLVTHGRAMDTEMVRPRRSLEELVDQLIAAMFKASRVTEAVVEPSAQRGSERPRGAAAAGSRGDVDTALAVLGDVDTGQRRRRGRPGGPSPSGKQMVRRRFGGRDALVYSQGAGRAAAVAPQGDGGTLEVVAVLGMRWKPGKLVSGRSLRGLRPLNGGA